MSKRERFKVSCVASSRGNYVRKTHRNHIKEVCESQEHKDILAEIQITIKVKPRYFVRCFGKMMQVTEREAAMLGKDIVITIQ